MKATKYTMSLRLEALSEDTLPGMLMKVQEELSRGALMLDIHYDDGDTISMGIDTEEVSF